MSTHQLVFESQDTESVLWRCSACLQPIGFAKEGLGTPYGSDKAIPENVDDWMGPCPANPALAENEIKVLQAKLNATLDALVQRGTLTSKEAEDIKAKTK